MPKLKEVIPYYKDLQVIGVSDDEIKDMYQKRLPTYQASTPNDESNSGETMQIIHRIKTEPEISEVPKEDTNLLDKVKQLSRDTMQSDSPFADGLKSIAKVSVDTAKVFKDKTGIEPPLYQQLVHLGDTIDATRKPKDSIIPPRPDNFVEFVKNEPKTMPKEPESIGEQVYEGAKHMAQLPSNALQEAFSQSPLKTIDNASSGMANSLDKTYEYASKNYLTPVINTLTGTNDNFMNTTVNPFLEQRRKTTDASIHGSSIGELSAMATDPMNILFGGEGGVLAKAAQGALVGGMMSERDASLNHQAIDPKQLTSNMLLMALFGGGHAALSSKGGGSEPRSSTALEVPYDKSNPSKPNEVTSVYDEINTNPMIQPLLESHTKASHENSVMPQVVDALKERGISKKSDIKTFIDENIVVSDMDQKITHILNDGQSLPNSMTGPRIVVKLKNTIEVGTQSPQDVYTKLKNQGASEELATMAAQSIAAKNPGIFNAWYLEKIKPLMENPKDTSSPTLNNRARDIELNDVGGEPQGALYEAQMQAWADAENIRRKENGLDPNVTAEDMAKQTDIVYTQPFHPNAEEIKTYLDIVLDSEHPMHSSLKSDIPTLQAINERGYDQLHPHEREMVDSDIAMIRKEKSLHEESMKDTQSEALFQAKMLEDRYLDKATNTVKIDELVKDSNSVLPKPIQGFDSFKSMFEKDSEGDNFISTPIGNVYLEPDAAYSHLTRNTHNENRIGISGAFFETFKDPLFIVNQKYKQKENTILRKGDKQTYREVDSTVFYKAFKANNDIYHLAGFTVDHNGRLQNSTYYEIKKQDLNKIRDLIKVPEKDLMYYKHPDSGQPSLSERFFTSRGADTEIIPQELHQTIKGAYNVDEKLIKIFKEHDVSTLNHELGHRFLFTLDAKEKAIAEQIFGVKDGQWTRKNHEAFADAYTRYIADGHVQTRGLKAIFEKFKQFTIDILSALKQNNGGKMPKLGEEMRTFFKATLGDEHARAELLKRYSEQTSHVEEPIHELYSKEGGSYPDSRPPRLTSGASEEILSQKGEDVNMLNQTAFENTHIEKAFDSIKRIDDKKAFLDGWNTFKDSVFNFDGKKREKAGEVIANGIMRGMDIISLMPTKWAVKQLSGKELQTKRIFTVDEARMKANAFINDWRNEKNFIYESAAELVGSIGKLPKEEQRSLLRALNGDLEASAIPEHLQSAYQTFRSNIDANADALIKAGILREKDKIEHYLKRYYQQYLDEMGEGGAGKMVIDKLKKRKDMDEETRLKLGMVEDASFVISNTIAEQHLLLQKARFLKQLAETFGHDEKIEGFVRISDETTGSGVKRYGELAGKWVHPEVAKELHYARMVGEEKGVLEQNIYPLIDHIKVNVTVKNPVSHAYNVASNVNMAFLNGDLVALGDVLMMRANNPEAFKALIKEANRYGLDSQLHEMEKVKNALYATDVQKDGIVKTILKNIYLAEGTSAGEKIRHLYDWEDKIFKVALFNKLKKQGIDPKEAMREAKEIYVDYSTPMPAALSLVDKIGVLPFIHYQYKSSKVVLKLAFKNPLRFAVMQAGIFAVGGSVLGDLLQGKSDEELKPEWAKNKFNLFGAKEWVKIPFADNWYMNMGRAIPGTKFDFEIGGFWKSAFNIVGGKTPLGQEIGKTTDSEATKRYLRLKTLGENYLPPFTLGRYGMRSVDIALGKAKLAEPKKNSYGEEMGFKELGLRASGVRYFNANKELDKKMTAAKKKRDALIKEYETAKEKGLSTQGLVTPKEANDEFSTRAREIRKSAKDNGKSPEFKIDKAKKGIIDFGIEPIMPRQMVKLD